MEDKESDSAEGRFTSPNGQDSDNRRQEGEGNNKKRSFSCVDENEALKAENESLRAKNSNLQDRNNELLARVGLLEAQKLVSIREDDEYAVQHGNGSITLSAIIRGHARVLEERLRRGADPNQKDKYGTSCLHLAAKHGRPECTRLLLKAGADVGVTDDGSNTVLFWLVRGFNGAQGPKEDFVLMADILIDAGAAIGMPSYYGVTVRDLLVGETDELDCAAIISLLEGRYWQHYGNRNPFLRASTAAETARLLMVGAANGNGGSNRDEHVNMTRVRSIAPNLRGDTFEALHQVLTEQRSFSSILLTTTRRPMVQSPFALLSGNETTVLPVIADFLGVRGRVLRNIREAARILQNIIINGDREFEFNIDRS